MVMEDVLRQMRACSPHPTRPNTLFNAVRVNAAAEVGRPELAAADAQRWWLRKAP
eukprot:gene27294-17408_t